MKRLSFVNRYSKSDRRTTLKYNKSKNLLLFKGNWVKPEIVYKMGFTDANNTKKCVKCGADTNSFKEFRCTQCELKHNKAMREIVNEVNNVLGDLL